MKTRTLKTLAFAFGLAVMMTGCGNRVPANPPIDDSALASPSPDPNAATPSVDPNATPVPAATANPAYSAPLTGSLTVGSISKTTHGILMFKKLEVKCVVTNTSNVALSGTVKVQFKKNSGFIKKTLNDDGTPMTQDISNLAPGQTQSVDITSTKSEDDAEITVDTQVPAAAPAPAAGATAASLTAGTAMGSAFGY